MAGDAHARRRAGPAIVSARRPRTWSESSALHAAPELDLLRRWVATLDQVAIVPWEGGTVSLVPRTATARAAVAIEVSEDGEAFHPEVNEPGDLPCDLVFGVSAIARDELARMQQLADKCPVIYAPNLTAGVAFLRLLAEISTRLDVADTSRADRPGGGDVARASGPRHGIADQPGLRLAALRTGDGADEHALFVAVPAVRSRPGHAAPTHRAFAPRILDAAAFVASAERRLSGLSALIVR